MTSRLAALGHMAMRGRLNLQPTTTSSIAIPGWSLMSMNALFCDVDSEFERNALAETIRRRVGLGSVQVTLTTTAASLAATRSPLYAFSATFCTCCQLLG